MQDHENLEEIVDVAMVALGHLLEFNTGIVIHEEDCSYIIHNDMSEDSEMYNVVTTRYPDGERDDLLRFSQGEILTMVQEGESIKPELSIVK